jgi:hypothetical protein
MVSNVHPLGVTGLSLGLEEYTTVLCARAAPGFLAEGIIGLSVEVN